MFRRQTTVCREGWYYLAILAVVAGGAMLKEVNLLLILAGMLLGPVLLNWQAVRTTLRGLRIERKLPPWIGAGDVLSVNLSLTNARRRLGSWAVVVEEQIQRESNGNHNSRGLTAPGIGRHREPPLRPCVLFPYVRAGQSSKGAYRGRLAQRGRYRFGPVRLSTRFPFGLFSRTITNGDSETLIVLPRLGRLTEGWAARRVEPFSGTHRRRRQPGPEGDFFGIREWRPGDGRRLIHWRSSARLGKLVVRQFERPRSRDVAVVLDLWRPEEPAAKDLKTVELAVSFAATVLADLCRKGGSNVYLATSQTTGTEEVFGANSTHTARLAAENLLRPSQAAMGVASDSDAAVECVGGPATPATLQGLMERLALVEGQSGDALPPLLAHALRRIAADTEIVLVSTRPVDLTDLSRWSELFSDPMLRERLRRIRSIDASSQQLEEYFQVE